MTMTFSEKMLQLISAAQELGIKFKLDGNRQTTFKYDGDSEVFDAESVAKEPWHLKSAWEPWFFSVAREKQEEELLLDSARVKMREAMKTALTVREREIFTSWLRGDRNVTL